MAPGGIRKQSGEQAKTPLKVFFKLNLSPSTKQGIAPTGSGHSPADVLGGMG